MTASEVENKMKDNYFLIDDPKSSMRESSENRIFRMYLKSYNHKSPIKRNRSLNRTNNAVVNLST